MPKTAAVRIINKGGQIALPMWIRKELNISEGADMEISSNGEVIIMKKHYPKCMFCGAENPKHSFNGNLICTNCKNDYMKINMFCPNCSKPLKLDDQNICIHCLKIIIKEGETARIKDPNVFNSELLEKRADFKPIQVGKDIIDVQYFHEDVYNNLLIANSELACRIYRNDFKIGTGVFYLHKTSHILYMFDLESIAFKKVLDYLSLWAKDNNIESIKSIVDGSNKNTWGSRWKCMDLGTNLKLMVRNTV